MPLNLGFIKSIHDFNAYDKDVGPSQGVSIKICSTSKQLTTGEKIINFPLLTAALGPTSFCSLPNS